MTREERNIKLKHYITCMKCEVSGKVCDASCPTQYAAGNIGEIIENLEAISEILEQQPCEDAISRQAVEKMIKAEMPERGMWEIEGDTVKDTVCEVCADLMQKLSELPSVTQKEKTGWIPISERLPENGQSVLFCDIDNDIMIGYHVKGRPDTHFSQDGTYEDIKDVRAWMPLPEPYRAESEDNDADSN